jgi:hypothetical protein
MSTLPIPLYPAINGVRCDFSSITFRANGAPIPGVTEINYSQELKGGEVRGTPIQVIGYTPGQLKCKADFTMLQLEWNLLVPVLALLASGTPLSGYMQARFDLLIQYQLPQSSVIIQDVIRGCKVASHEMSNKLGSDALCEKVELEPFYILKNNVAPVVYGNNGMVPG